MSISITLYKHCGYLFLRESTQNNKPIKIRLFLALFKGHQLVSLEFLYSLYETFQGFMNI